MDPEDLEPRKKQAALKPLEPMSIGELEAYIAELQGEIERARSAITRKQSIRAGAASLFKS